MPVDTITEIGVSDPNRFTDPDPTPRNPPAKAPRNRPARPIDIILKSSPPGAQAAVDGVIVGHTPAYWYGESDGREHEFTFVLGGHTSARYRFVPIQSGTVHAKLDLVSDEVPDAGVDPVTSQKQPTFTPDPRPAPLDTPKPPDTVITPGSGSAQGSATGSGSGSSTGEFNGFPGKGPQP
jgi:hypothetical protein